MEVERRILRSTTILLSAGLASQVANFVFVIYFARAYSPDIFGGYSFALSLGSLLSILVSLGTNGLLLRKCSQAPGEWRHQVGILFPAQMSLAIATWLVIVIAVKLLGLSGSELHIVGIVTSFQLLAPIWGLFCVGFTATERMAYAALANFSIKTLIMLVGGVAIWSGATAQVVLLILPSSALVATLILARLAFSEFGLPQFRLDWAALRRLWHEALPFLGLSALSVAQARVGLLFLRAAGGAEQVGVFASAERLVMAASILHVTFADAIFPAMVKLISTDQSRFGQLADRCARLILLISLPLASVLYLFAEDLIGLMFGEAYRQASSVLRIVAWLIALRGIRLVLEAIGIASDHRRIVLLAKATELACLLVLCSFLLSSMGANGLAISLLTAQGLNLTILYYGLRRTGYLPSVLGPCLPTLLACLITVSLVMMIANQDLWLRLIVAATLGTFFLWLFRAIRAPDIAFLGRILRSSSPAHREI